MGKLKGKNNEAIEEFKQIRKNNDVGFGARVALFFIYSNTKQIGNNKKSHNAKMYKT